MMRIAIAGSTGLVGRSLTTRAVAAGHEVVGLSRGEGVDLVTGPPPDLAGVDAVVDVTQSDDIDGQAAERFFTAVATTLGAASRAAEVPRTVVLSILGADLTAAEIDYNAAKVAHERATREATTGVIVLRAAQFHDFPGQWARWMAEDGVVEVPDQPIQPVELDEVVAQLLVLATDPSAPESVELAGPEVLSFPSLVERVAPDLRVVPIPVGPVTAGGGLLARQGTRIAGRPFAAWLADQEQNEAPSDS